MARAVGVGDHKIILRRILVCGDAVFGIAVQSGVDAGVGVGVSCADDQRGEQGLVDIQIRILLDLEAVVGRNDRKVAHGTDLVAVLILGDLNVADLDGLDIGTLQQRVDQNVELTRVGAVFQRFIAHGVDNGNHVGLAAILVHTDDGTLMGDKIPVLRGGE